MQAEKTSYKNMREYRTWYRESRNQRADRNDEHFVGTDSPRPGRYGFFELVHGDKAKIENLLTGNMDMADDSQGIYEFIQNAADCDATQFHLFFNEKYFLALNNGFAFTSGGVKAILNIAQSSEDKENPGKIGRYGIGFKLVHRLVGKGNGINELMNDYTGPVIFSWSDTADFQSFISGIELTPTAFEPEAAQAGKGAPWLFKILMTCFPAMPGEEVLDLNHQPRVGFTAQELEECRTYLQTCAPTLDPTTLGQGSLFFLRLGEGKSQKLSENEQALGNGMRSALHLLGSLRHVAVQGKAVERLEDLHMESFTVKCDDPRLKAVPLENTRDRRSNLECTFGFAPVDQATALLRTEASFYKYFPVAAEDAPYTFVLHSNLLGIEPNRTQLQPNDINKKLLPLSVELLHERLAAYTVTNPSLARRIWGGVLLSDEPPMGQKHAWQKPVFYDPLLAGLTAVVPTASGGFRPAGQVKIRNTKLTLDLATLGIAGQEWFYWDNGSEPARHAASKLKLVRWDLADLLLYGELAALCTWTRGLDSENYLLLTQELTGISEARWKADNNRLLSRFFSVEFFRFSDKVSRSLVTTLADRNTLLLAIGGSGAIVIDDVLLKLGFQTAYLGESAVAAPLGKLLTAAVPYLAKPTELYARINALLTTASATLSPAEKLQLFIWFEKLGIDTPTLRKLVLFRNAQSKPTALGEMASKEVALPGLLKWAEVHADDYSPQLEKYLLKKPSLYIALIQTRWESWETLLTRTNLPEFCRLAVDWYAAADNKSPLPNGKTALTAAGWQPTGTVYYHSKLSESDDYDALGEAIAALYGWQVPVTEMLPWLGTEPFKLDTDTLATIPKTATILTAPQFAALRALAQADGSRLTDFMTVQGVQADYRLTPRPSPAGRPQPCYTADAQLRAVLEAYCPNLHLLPLDATGRALQDEAAVLKDAKLLTALLDALPDAEAQSEATVDLMGNTTFSTVARDWLGRLPRVIVKLESEYAANHPVRRILTLAADTLKTEEQVAFRRKLFLSAPSHATFTLDGAAEADEIRLETGSDTTVILRRSQLLPGADEQSVLVNLLAERLDADAGLRTLLGLGETHDHDRLQQQLLAELTASSRVLQNATQAAYVVLTATQSKVYSLTDFELLADDDKTYPLAGDWYAVAPTFIDRSYVLAPAFTDLPKLLKLKGELPYVVGAEFKLFTRPYLTADGLHAPGLGDDPDETEQQELLTFLYERWEKREQQTNKYDWPTDWTTLNGISAAQALGFTPSETVLPAALSTAAETAPAWLPTWAAAKSPVSRTCFLAALGVEVGDGPLARLRQAFRLEPGSGPASALFASSLSEPGPAQQGALLRTLNWLHENDISVSTRWHQQVLTELFDRLTLKEYNFKLFAYLTGYTANGTTHYKVLPNGDNDLLLNDEVHQHLLAHEVSFSQLLEWADLVQHRVLDLRLYPADWQSLTCDTAEPLMVKCAFNRTLLQEESNEIASLNEWANASKWATAICHVYTVPGMLPQIRTLLGQSLPARRHGNLWVDEEEGQLYVSEDKLFNLPELLEQQSNVFEETEITALRQALRDHKAAQTSTELARVNQQLADQQEQDRQKDAQLAEQARKLEELGQRIALMELARTLKQPDTHPTLGEEDPESLGDIQGTKAATEASREAVAKAKEWLHGQAGYDCTKWQVDYSTVRGVLYHGKPLTLVVKSARGGSLFLTPFDWVALANEKPSVLLVLTANGRIQPTTLEDLEQDERNRRYSLKISLNQRTPPKILTALAGFYRELYGETGVQTTFKFYQPGANYTDSLEVPLRGFFGPETNPAAGPVSAQPDDVL